MPELIHSFLFSPFWAKGFSTLAIFLVTFLVERNRVLPVVASFRTLAWCLLATDFVSMLLPELRVLPLVQELLVLVLFGQILGTISHQKTLPILFWILGIPAVAFTVAADVWALPEWANVVGPTVIILLWIDQGRRWYAISEYNTDSAGVVLKSRTPLIVALLAVNALGLVAFPWGGLSAPFLQMIGLPFLNLVYAWVLLIWDSEAQSEERRQHGNLERNLNSLFEFMVAIGNAISEKLEMDKVLDFVVKSAVKATNADGGAVFLVDEFEDVMMVKAVEGDFPPPYQVPPKVKAKISSLAEYFAQTPIPLDKTIVGECALTRQGIYIRDSRDDERMAQNAHLDQIYIASIILTPLMQGSRVFGVLAVVSRRGNYLFTPEHFTQIKTFADYTSLTINSLFTYLQLLEKQEMEREVGIAADIQGQLLPTRLPRVSSVTLAAYSLPAKGVSGDYYDVINIRKGQLLCAVCDVAGKGIPASLVMVMIRTIIHLVAHQPGMTVSRILDTVNWGIAGKVSLDRFATVSLMSYDFTHHRLEYSNAAHHPLLVYRTGTGQFESLDTEGIPIGLEKKTRYEQIAVTLDPGDIVVMYTDGIIEAMNEQSQQYGLEAFQTILSSHAKESPDRIKKAIIDDLNTFVGKARQHDDQTFLLMKIEQDKRG